MILTPGSASGVTLLPLSDLAELATAPPGTVLAQVGGNLLVFAALGALLPVRSARFAGTWRVALLAALLSITVEVLQYGLHLGRVSSVDDVLLNSAGAALASLATRRWHARPLTAGTGPQ
ncbi:VanZ family protein [Sphaerisporangium sp. NPDC051017]|uniref:VanZ family protein n=1 Tax=unclassified Sphaerisporangium TaxID=2630420 RepID=UPI00340FD0B3